MEYEGEILPVAVKILEPSVEEYMADRELRGLKAARGLPHLLQEVHPSLHGAVNGNLRLFTKSVAAAAPELCHLHCIACMWLCYPCRLQEVHPSLHGAINGNLRPLTWSIAAAAALHPLQVTVLP